MNYTKPLALPKYTDDEVKIFHPVLGYCLCAAIDKLQLKGKYQVAHHYDIGSLTVDFAIINSVSKKVLLPIEVKRTSGSVSSTRYRNQAKTYVVEGGRSCETQFYVLTNLEVTELYRYDPARGAVASQLLEPGPILVGKFDKCNLSVFLERLTGVFSLLLRDVIANTYKYKQYTSEFIDLLGSSKGNKWHEVLMPSCFEYIRGALKGKSKPVSNWKTAVFFKEKPNNLGVATFW